MRKKGRFSLLLSLCILALIFLFSGCTGGSDFYETGETGTYELTVAWPEAANPDTDAKLIPTGAHFINVSVEGEGLSSAVTAGITYPQTALRVDNLPKGKKVATIQTLNSSSNLLAQRKESFLINSAETTNSGNIPLGIALTGTTTNPVFQPNSIQVPYGAKLYFQNWLNTGFTVRASTNGVNNDISIPGFDSNGNYFCGIFTMSGRGSAWSLPAKAGVTGSTSIVINKIVSGAPVRIVDLLPKSYNGEGGVYCKKGYSVTNGFSNIDRTGDYTYVYVRNWVYPSGNNLIMRCDYSPITYLLIPLNASGFSKIKLTGKVKNFYYDSRDYRTQVSFFINSGKEGTPFFNTGTMNKDVYYTIDTSSTYAANDTLFIRVSWASADGPRPVQFEDFYLQGTN